MSFSLTSSIQNLHSSPNKTRIEENQKKDWNAMIKHQANLKNDQAILSIYTQMESLHIAPPDHTALPLVLKACSRLNSIEKGKKIHSAIKHTDLIRNIRVSTALIDFYSKCGYVHDARQVFDEMKERDLVAWNAMISGYAGSNEHENAVLLFLEMINEEDDDDDMRLRPNSRSMVALLSGCEKFVDLRFGEEIHGYCIRNGLFDSDPHVGTALIGFYSIYDVTISRSVFDMMVTKNIVTWNAMITAYFDVGEHYEALNLFVSMIRDRIRFDSVTMLVVIQASAEFRCIELGMQIHQTAIKFGFTRDLFVVNALVNMYGAIGCVDSSVTLFDSIEPRKDVALWNSMISSYIECGWFEEAVSLFRRMREDEGIDENERTVVIMLSLCKHVVDRLRKVKSVHARATKNGMTDDDSIRNALLRTYSELNCTESALKVYKTMKNVDVVSHNVLIKQLACNELTDKAWEIFTVMRESESESKPNAYTMISILAVCKDETLVNTGRSIHGFAIKHGMGNNLSLNTCLIDMYMNCGDEITARTLFEVFCRDRDSVSWNALIGSYLERDRVDEAMFLFRRMVLANRVNSVTVITILSCIYLSNLREGSCVHAYVLRRREYSCTRFPAYGFELSIANALITMYARCGSIKSAKRIFENMVERDIVSWNGMIAGYGMHGYGYDAISSFTEMIEHGFRPNRITFLSVLSACSHSGLVEKGLAFFSSMTKDYNITPELPHYGCVVDLLGRAGNLNEAIEFIEGMPIEPDASVWRALFSACRDHSDVVRAGIVFEKLVELEPNNAGNYVLMSNIYAAAGLWSDVRKIRSSLTEKGLKKPPGVSSIVVRDQIHSFTVADRLHPLCNDIYAILKSLLSSAREMGYVPDFRLML